MVAITLAFTAVLTVQEPGTVVAADTRVQERSYVFAETGKTVPYALFVPFTYSASKKSPLIVALHGLGRPFDWMMGWVAKMQELGMAHVYVEVKGGDHSLFVSQDREMLSKGFSFFNIDGKTTRGSI